jgi:hypothetical protein
VLLQQQLVRRRFQRWVSACARCAMLSQQLSTGATRRAPDLCIGVKQCRLLACLQVPCISSSSSSMPREVAACFELAAPVFVLCLPAGARWHMYLHHSSTGEHSTSHLLYSCAALQQCKSPECMQAEQQHLPLRARCSSSAVYT